MRIFIALACCVVLSSCAASSSPDRFSRSLVLCANGSFSSHCPLPDPRRPDLKW